MDFCPPNAPISATQHHNLTTTQQPPPNGSNGSAAHGGTAAGGGPLSHLLPQQPIEGDETSEWLSVFVEDCLSSPGDYLLAPANDQHFSTTTKSSNPNPYPNETLKPHLLQNPDQNPKTKPRKKPRSIMKLKHHKIPSIFDLHLEDLLAELNPNPNPDPDPPLLHQAHWLADSEPIFPIHQPEPKPKPEKENLVDVAVQLSLSASDHCTPQNHKTRKGPKKGSGPRKCSHCQAEKTPLWRQGPSGKGTLCNACGVRWLKSGNLFPEYRPANSPTFVSDLHSNVLRKVLKMREAREAPGGSGLSSSDDH